MKMRIISSLGLTLTSLFISGCAFSGSPLYKASMNGRSNEVRELLNNGASVDERGGYGFTPLWMAARYGHADAVSMLLDKGANVNDEQNYIKLSPLAIAVTYNHVDVVRVLLAKGANPNCAASIVRQGPVHDGPIQPSWYMSNDTEKYLSCYTPLMLAADKGQAKIVELLLKYGAGVNLINQETAVLKIDESTRKIMPIRGSTALTSAKSKYRQLGPSDLKEEYRMVIQLLEKAGGKDYSEEDLATYY